jgi:hypothetical protein
MSILIEVLAWFAIAFGTLPVVLRLIDLEAGRSAAKHRHGRPVTFAEVWPDIRYFLPFLAVGLSLLGHQWNTDTAGWWLAQLPLLAATAVYFIAWLGSRVTGRPSRVASDREIRAYLLVFGSVTPLLSYPWPTGTPGWWLMHVPLFAAGAVYLEAAVRYLARHRPGRPQAEPS